jgi:hypothetical protein
MQREMPRLWAGRASDVQSTKAMRELGAKFYCAADFHGVDATGSRLCGGMACREASG